MDCENTAKAILKRAKELNLTITCAESCTGGLISAALTHSAGASAVFERGFVTYSNQAKMDMLDVSQETLGNVGAVSEEVAQEMADGARQNASAQLAISVTGIAGPGGSDFKPEGRVCFGLSTNSGPTYTETVEFGALGREHVRLETVKHALTMTLNKLNSISD
ncbi:MAG: CinA family protein [Litoreibacter sp.]